MSMVDPQTLGPLMGEPGRASASGLGARALKALFSVIRYGHLKLTLPSGATLDFAGTEPGPEAVMHIHRWRFLWRSIRGGSVGFSEAYVDGDWSSPDVVATLRLLLMNRDAMGETFYGNRLFVALERFNHWRRRNSKSGSRKNIEFHYDLGNDFYRLWLDPSMMYSSAIWEGPRDDLEIAQRRRLDRIAELLDLAGGEEVLEIGCGWGALAMHLAREKNVALTGLTLSPSQLEWAQQRVAEADLTSKVDLRLQDYRDHAGEYDRIVSIEMAEAVGEAYLPGYFETLAARLKTGGTALLQIITIDEAIFDRYRAHPDFIQKHIFPGGFLPTKAMIADLAEKAGLKLVETEHFGHSYARTLAEWRRRFHAHWPEIAAQGFDARFRRLWEYYLSYCESGFEEGDIDVGFYRLVK